MITFQIENNRYCMHLCAMMRKIADDSMISVLTRPITATLLTLGIIALVTAVFRQRKLDKNQALIDDS